MKKVLFLVAVIVLTACSYAGAQTVQGVTIVQKTTCFSVGNCSLTGVTSGNALLFIIEAQRCCPGVFPVLTATDNQANVYAAGAQANIPDLLTISGFSGVLNSFIACNVHAGSTTVTPGVSVSGWLFTMDYLELSGANVSFCANASAGALLPFCSTCSGPTLTTAGGTFTNTFTQAGGRAQSIVFDVVNSSFTGGMVLAYEWTEGTVPLPTGSWIAIQQAESRDQLQYDMNGEVFPNSKLIKVTQDND